MSNIINTLEKLAPLSAQERVAVDEVCSRMYKVSLRKGEYLYECGDIPDFEAYVERGMLRHYVTDNNCNEKIIQFYKEEDFIHDCKSFETGVPVDYSVQALEDCELLLISLADVAGYCRNVPLFDRVGFTMMQAHLANYQEHITIIMKYTPEERYKYVLEHKPELIQRLSVTHLAQFLGLSRETLSRMRAKVVESSIL